MSNWVPLPSEICGVKIPKVSMEDLTDVDKLKGLATNVAISAGAHATGLDGVLDSSKDVHNVLQRGSKAVGNGCNVLAAGAESIGSIQTAMAPLMPLFNAKNDPVGAFKEMNQKNLEGCLDIIRHVLSLQTLLDTVGKILHEVVDAFSLLKKSAQPLVDKVKEVLQSIADNFESSLNFEGCLTGIETFFSELAKTVSELSDISAVLKPILDGCEEKHYADAAVFGGQRWEEVMDALQRFLPAWDQVQKLYNKSQVFSAKTHANAGPAWDSFAALIEQICGYLKVPVPEWMSTEENPLKDTIVPGAVEIKSVKEEDADPLSRLLFAVMKCCANNKRK